MSIRTRHDECHNHDFQEVSRYEVTGAVGTAYMITYQCQNRNCEYSVERFKRE